MFYYKILVTPSYPWRQILLLHEIPGYNNCSSTSNFSEDKIISRGEGKFTTYKYGSLGLCKGYQMTYLIYLECLLRINVFLIKKKDTYKKSSISNSNILDFESCKIYILDFRHDTKSEV